MARDLNRLDPNRMHERLRELPQQLRDAGARSLPDGIPERPRAVAFLGMGGSGISGALIAALAADSAPVPVICVRGYDVPRWMGEGVLGVAVSYSGGTEETLTAARAVLDRGGRLVAVTSGGALGDLAVRSGHPTVSVPPGMPPRAAFGYLFGTVWRIASHLKLVPPVNLESRADRLAEALAGIQPDAGGEPSAKVASLADHIGDAMPLIVAPEGALSACAHRWCCQINENAKRKARSVVLPECDHNEVVGWCAGDPPAPVVFLDDPSERREIRERVQVTAEIMAEGGGVVQVVNGDGEDRWDRILALCALGDALSLELAYRRSVDPTPIPQIDRLKKALARSRAEEG